MGLAYQPGLGPPLEPPVEPPNCLWGWCAWPSWRPDILFRVIGRARPLTEWDIASGRTTSGEILGPQGPHGSTGFCAFVGSLQSSNGLTWGPVNGAQSISENYIFMSMFRLLVQFRTFRLPNWFFEDISKWICMVLRRGVKKTWFPIKTYV